MRAAPRIALIHALRDSIAPAAAAMAEGWPEARAVNLLDDSLSADLAAGAPIASFDERFATLGRYARDCGADGILFTCSAFGGPISACRAALKIPVLKPNEAALEEALAAGPRIALLASFGPTVPSMAAELRELARAMGREIETRTAVAEGALAALQAGRAEEHDRLVAAAAEALPPIDALVLAQFSLARAANAIPPRSGRRVVSTPSSAVAKLRAQVEGVRP